MGGSPDQKSVAEDEQNPKGSWPKKSKCNQTSKRGPECIHKKSEDLEEVIRDSDGRMSTYVPFKTRVASNLEHGVVL